MRAKITLKHLKHRVSKLEAEAAVSAPTDIEVDEEMFRSLMSSERTEFIHLMEELVVVRTRQEEAARTGEVKCMDEIRRNDSKIILSLENIKQRPALRRERYPLLWQSLRSDVYEKYFRPCADPWSIDGEINALRNYVARKWELIKGLALDLDALTLHDLTVFEHLDHRDWPYTKQYWVRVKSIATPDDIEQVLAKVLLVARAIQWDRSGEPSGWEDVGRPLTWTDLRFDPATFPWNETNRASGYLSWWRARSIEASQLSAPQTPGTTSHKTEEAN